MRANNGPFGPLRRLERWIFRPGDPRRLAAARIGLCLLLAARLSRPMYLQLAGQPRALFRPISFMHLLPAMPVQGVALAVQIIAVAACVLGAAGAFTRLSVPVAWLGALFLNGMWTSVGQPMHNDTLPLLAMVPVLFAPTADAWSVDAMRRPRPSSAPSCRYGWPLRTAMLMVAGAYFFSGFNKLLLSGPAWFLSGNLRWILFASSDTSPHPVKLALFLAGHPLAAQGVAAMTLLIELGFPLTLWKPMTAWFFVPAVGLLHLGIWFTMHLDYSAWILTVIVLFVPWDAVADREGILARIWLSPIGFRDAAAAAGTQQGSLLSGEQ